MPPPYHTGPPSLLVSPGSATAYPVTWPGFFVLNRLRVSTPASEVVTMALYVPSASLMTVRPTISELATCSEIDRPGAPMTARPLL